MKVTQQLAAAPALQFNNRKVEPLHRLPFVGRGTHPYQLCFWTVPKTGGYAGGNNAGRGLARIYLKYLKQHGRPEGLGALQWIVRDMFDSDSDGPRTPEQSARRGQVVGFFDELDAWLHAAVCHLEGGLDRQSNEALLDYVNAGLIDEQASVISRPRKARRAQS
ncbi:hypothetical protein [Pseudomonas sp. MYb185]|uniref:hypothetical protein n=1 Tax=Pseudomonas sp. MYb185 TaxID=1848729 RepID=UPI000CFD573F|nr:hypothetical protein [Pseudomonas sp. MYb185]PRB80543.1 hypothetical protein CQ007_12555 [Pseudomonas sp. MYb185]